MFASHSGLVSALSDRYRIERELGQGGMATVYLAQDLKHERRVALKVLRPELAAVIGADRFLAEIKTTANLQHPHILPLHDSGEADGTVFYVMPYVEGESLRDRLNKEKQLPIDTALRIAKETASALDYAHRHGIVHRDIKPENILLHDGQALVADFGISFAVSRSEGAQRMTETGMSLGTPSYMAPEQAMGDREITQRADIYALGAVLYEMLTGEPPFTGATAQAIVARMVTEQPRGISTQRHTVPEHIEAAVMMALEKLPADRFATAAEFSAALDNPGLTHGTQMTSARARTKARSRRRDQVIIGVLATTTIVSAAVAISLIVGKPVAPVTRFALSFPLSAAPMPDRMMMVSLDGARLGYVGPGDGNATVIYIKERGKEAPTPLAGTANVSSFTFSPDGQWIAYVTAGQQLRKMPINGGAAISLADTASPTRGVAWLDDNTIVYARNGGLQLLHIPDVGGTPAVVWRTDSVAAELAVFPAAIPGEKAILFTACRGGGGCPGGTAVYALDLDGGTPTLVAAGALRAEYIETGHVLYGRLDGGLMAIPFSARSLKPTGAAVPVMDSITVTPFGSPTFTVSRDGTLYTRTGPTISSTATYELAWADRQGRETTVDSSFTFRLTSFGANVGWALSPSGDRVAIGLNTDAGDNVWVKQLPRGPLSRITFDSNPSFRPRWWHDGRSVVYTKRMGANARLFRRPADGTGTEELVYHVDGPGIYEGAWAPGGKTLVLRAGGTVSVVGGRDIMVAQLGVDSQPRPLIASAQFDESGIALAPDGKWIAYESNETGRTEVYIRPFPNTDGGKWQVSTDGGRAPLWNRNGRELFFIDGTRRLVSAPITFGSGAQIGIRNPLFKLRDEIYLANQENYTPFDVSADGQRFLMARMLRATAQRISPLVVTENWFTELRQRVAKP